MFLVLTKKLNKTQESVYFMLYHSDEFTIYVHNTTSGTSEDRKKVIERWKKALIHKHIAHYLGIIKREFDERLDESTVEIFDETHMMIDMINGRVMDFQGSKHVR